jgi:hypothetical protein
LVADSESEKVIKARQWNESAGASSTMHLHIVRKQWLEDSVSAGAALDEAQYSFDGAPVVPKLDASGEKNFGVDARPTKFKASTPTKHLPLAVPPQDPLPDRSMIPFDQSTLERNHHRPPNFTLISQVNGSGFMRSSVKPKPPTELADLASTASTELAPPLRKQRLEESVCVDHVLADAHHSLVEAPIVLERDVPDENNLCAGEKANNFKSLAATMLTVPQGSLAKRSIIPFEQLTLGRNPHRPPNLTLLLQMNVSFIRLSIEPSLSRKK